MSEIIDKKLLESTLTQKDRMNDEQRDMIGRLGKRIAELEAQIESSGLMEPDNLVIAKFRSMSESIDNLHAQLESVPAASIEYLYDYLIEDQHPGIGHELDRVCRWLDSLNGGDDE